MTRYLYLLISIVTLLLSLKYFFEYGDLYLNGIQKEATVVEYTPLETQRLFSKRTTHRHLVKVGDEYQKVNLSEEHNIDYKFMLRYVPNTEGRYQIEDKFPQPLAMGIAMFIFSLMIYFSEFKVYKQRPKKRT